MNTKYNELEEVYEVDLKNTSGAELLAIETPNKYVTYAGLERAVRNVLSKAKDYDKGLAGGYNGTFPLTAATKGNIYLLPATKKYYICIKDYSGSQLSAPNSNFEELSVYANRSKLDNLFQYGGLSTNSKLTNSGGTYHFQNNLLKIIMYIDIWSNGGIDAGTELFNIPLKNASYAKTHIDAYTSADNTRVKLNIANNTVILNEYLSKEKGALFINLSIR